jgi:hypothetical protein
MCLVSVSIIEAVLAEFDSLEFFCNFSRRYAGDLRFTLV